MLATIRPITADRTQGSSGSGAAPQNPLVRDPRGAVVIGGDFKATRANGPHIDHARTSARPMDLRLGRTVPQIAPTTPPSDARRVSITSTFLN